MMIKPLLSVVVCLLSVTVVADTLKVVTGPDYPPYTDPKLPNGGLVTELVSKTLQRAGWNLALSWRPWANGYQATLAGEFAATFPYIRTAEREKVFLFSEPLFEIKAYVFALPERNFDGAQPKTLTGSRYCMPLGWALLPIFARMQKNKEITIVSPNDMSSCMKLIALKKVDFTVTDLVQGEEATHQLAAELPKPIALGGVVDRQTLHLLMPIHAAGSSERMARFNQALHAQQKTR
ncbi:transporter substrate-binding domain-containing protein [Chitinibacter sp. SCUT-21]|uniref:substrate-binding periplasmic protein n=1 Tax=Chitinibacter sp. SCUT-21 TaxID=2970891 RepID=UPI0035A667F9